MLNLAETPLVADVAIGLLSEITLLMVPHVLGRFYWEQENEKDWEIPRMVALYITNLAGACGLITVAIWPGFLEDGFCLLLPFVGCWMAFVVGLAVRDFAVMTKPGWKGRRWGLWSAVVMLGSAVVLWTHIPQRIGLALYLTRFQRVAEMEASRVMEGGLESAHKIGPYTVDRVGSDDGGGIYLRTHFHSVGFFGFEHVSYGFSYRPNGNVTSFGHACLRRHHLFGEWYSFSVSGE